MRRLLALALLGLPPLLVAAPPERSSPAAARPAATRSQSDPRRYYYEDIFTPFFASEDGRSFRTARPGGNSGEFSMPKPPGTFRVFLVGGSIASIQGIHARNLGDALKRALPSRTVEYLNCGMGGYESYREALLLQELLEYQPDLIVLLTGHNEMLGSPPVPVWLLKTRERLDRVAAFRKLAEKLQWTDAQIPYGSERLAALVKEREKTFAENLRNNLRQLKARGVPVVVASPALNYRDAAPVSELPLQDPEFAAGWAAFLRGRWGEALPHFTAAAEARGNDNYRNLRPMSLFFRARGLDRLGRHAEALADYRAAIAADSDSRCAPSCQEIIRTVAAEQGALWADVDGAFLSRAAPRAPGLDLFYDKLHWRPQYNALVSLALLEPLVASAQLRGLPWDEHGLAALRREWSRLPAADEDLDAAQTMAQVDWEGGVDGLSPRGVLYLDWVYSRRPGWFAKGGMDGAFERAGLRLLDLGGALRPWRLSSQGRLWHWAEMLLQRRRHVPALKAYEEALALEPERFRVRVHLGIAAAMAGDKKLARRSLAQALAESGRGIRSPFTSREADGLARALGLGSLEPAGR